MKKNETQFPERVGLAELIYSVDTELPVREGCLIKLPLQEGINLNTIQDGCQFLFTIPQTGDSSEREQKTNLRCWFGGTDEQVFLTEVEGSLWEKFRIGGEGAFYESLQPKFMKTLANKWNVELLRQGDIFALPVPYGSWFELIASFSPPPAPTSILRDVGRVTNWDINKWNPFDEGSGERPNICVGDLVLFETRHILRGTFSASEKFSWRGLSWVANLLINDDKRKRFDDALVHVANTCCPLNEDSYEYPIIIGEGICYAPDHKPLVLKGLHLIAQAAGLKKVYRSSSFSWLPASSD